MFDQDGTGVTTEVVFALKAISKLSSYVDDKARVLVITGKSSAKKSGALEQVQAQLAMKHATVVLFDEIEPNPLLSTVQKCVSAHKDDGITTVIGIGGGSAMDAAKAIALGLGGVNFVSKEEQAHDKVPKLLCVPTAAGSGSEVTQYSILTIPERNTKVGIPQHLFPHASFVDPEFMRSIPLEQKRSMFFDIMCHAMESSLGQKRSEIQTKHAMNALLHLSRAKQFLEGATEFETLSAVSKASVEAGISISMAGTSLPHGFSYPVTYYKHVSHGYACALFIVKFLGICDQEIVAKLLKQLGWTRDELSEKINGYV